MIPEPSLFELEDRGYGNGMGHLCLPNGSHVAVAHSDDATSIVLLLAAWNEWENS